MSNFILYSYGSLDCSSLESYQPDGDFCISIEFDLIKKGENALTTFYFFLCNKGGFEDLIYKEKNFMEKDIQGSGFVLKKSEPEPIQIHKMVEEYSFEFVQQYLQEHVIQKTIELNDEDLFKYLHQNFNYDED